MLDDSVVPFHTTEWACDVHFSSQQVAILLDAWYESPFLIVSASGMLKIYCSSSNLCIQIFENTINNWESGCYLFRFVAAINNPQATLSSAIRFVQEAYLKLIDWCANTIKAFNSLIWMEQLRVYFAVVLQDKSCQIKCEPFSKLPLTAYHHSIFMLIWINAAEASKKKVWVELSPLGTREIFHQDRYLQEMHQS